MYGRFVGHYSLVDVFRFFLPYSDCDERIREYLPKKKIYLFSLAREAIYVALLNRKKISKRKYVAIPGWGCPIILATVYKAGFIPLLFDISPKTLHMDIDEIIQVSKSYDIDSAILIAENGISYNSDDLQKIQKNGICVIADYAIGWQNFKLECDHPSDYDIFCCGFSKPISGLGLGILATDENIEIPGEKYLPFWNDGFQLFKMLSHILLQNGYIYSFINSLIPIDLQNEYRGEIFHPSLKSKSIALNSLERIEKIKYRWKELQSSIRSILIQYGSKSPIIFRPDCLQSKIIFEKNLLRSIRNSEIEFHQQYKYSLLNDERCEKINSDYHEIKVLKNEYVSFALNYSIIKNKEHFLNALNNSLN